MAPYGNDRYHAGNTAGGCGGNRIAQTAEGDCLLAPFTPYVRFVQERIWLKVRNGSNSCERNTLTADSFLWPWITQEGNPSNHHRNFDKKRGDRSRPKGLSSLEAAFNEANEAQRRSGEGDYVELC